ncbi:MAG: response regulator [Polyangiaceae bacterium]|nr:response regulator [Polyangiaceae bacterium]
MSALRILLVEDDQPTAIGLARVLEKEQFEVESVVDGRAALDSFDRQPADIVITDLKLPGMNGLELMRAVKRRSPDVPVILMTAFGETDAAVEAIRLGALDYFRKPVQLEELLLAVGRARELIVRRQRDSQFPTVLLAEDDATTRERLTEILRKENWHVLPAKDGAHALEVFEANKVDVALLDLKMPRMDGLSALAAMRRARQNFVAVILTGYGDEDAAIQALRNGAMGFIRKPIDLEELLVVLDKAKEKLSTEQALRYRMREVDLAHQIIAQISEHGEIVVTLSDLTLSDVRQRVAAALDHLGAWLLLIDDDDRVVFANAPAAQLWGSCPRSLDETMLETLATRSRGALPAKDVRDVLDRSRDGAIGGAEVFGAQVGLVSVKGRARVGGESENYRLVILKGLGSAGHHVPHQAP